MRHYKRNPGRKKRKEQIKFHKTMSVPMLYGSEARTAKGDGTARFQTAGDR